MRPIERTDDSDPIPSIHEDLVQAARAMIEVRPEHGDVYLCYTDLPQSHPGGLLVTERDNLDEPLAYCPLAPRPLKTWAQIAQCVARQLPIALRIAEDRAQAIDPPDAIGLMNAGTPERPMPHWVYGLSCVPLTRDWNGRFETPRPFCAELFSAMARQPRAEAWIRLRQGLVPG